MRAARAMIDRSAQIGMFGGYQIPIVNIAADAECADFVTPAKAAGIPPFARLLHAIARASLDVPEFRLRLTPDLAVVEVGDRLTLSYTALGTGDNLNFSTFPFADDFQVFLGEYLADRDRLRAHVARGDTSLRLSPIGPDRAWLFVTCMPWLRFTSLQHPVADGRDCSIPNIAVGRFDIQGGRVRFPISVQAHHGLVDALHIARLIDRVRELMDRAAAEDAAP